MSLCCCARQHGPTRVEPMSPPTGPSANPPEAPVEEKMPLTGDGYGGHGAAPVSDGENAKAEAKGKGKGPGKAAKGKGGMSYKEKQQAELAEKEESLSAPEGFTGKDPLSDWEIQVLHGATDQEEGPPLGEDGAGDAEIRGAEASADAVASGPAGQRSNEDGGETARVPSERRGPAAGRVLLANLFGDLWGVKLSAPSLLRTQWGFTTLPPDEESCKDSVLLALESDGSSHTDELAWAQSVLRANSAELRNLDSFDEPKDPSHVNASPQVAVAPQQPQPAPVGDPSAQCNAPKANTPSHDAPPQGLNKTDQPEKPPDIPAESRETQAQADTRSAWQHDKVDFEDCGAAADVLRQVSDFGLAPSIIALPVTGRSTTGMVTKTGDRKIDGRDDVVLGSARKASPWCKAAAMTSRDDRGRGGPVLVEGAMIQVFAWECTGLLQVTFVGSTRSFWAFASELLELLQRHQAPLQRLTVRASTTDAAIPAGEGVELLFAVLRGGNDAGVESLTVEELVLRDELMEEVKCFMARNNLSSLALKQCGLEGAQAEKLLTLEGAQSEKLTHLDLSRNALGLEGANVLANWLPSLPTLQVLMLGGNALGPAGLATLVPALAPSLKILDLSLNGLGTTGIEALMPAELKLESLNLTLG
ncbi:unnamed protein product [Durusdinium trenchii]|uniref:Uncharacterized protein n=1 Tax=Durusdinium trenchii TaxID=1381693 RepID=A0ABP0P3J9_9DINO